MREVSKCKLREEKLKQRKELSELKVKSLSEKICDTLLKMPVINKNNNIMLYIDFRNEVKTTELIKELLNLDKRVIVPYTDVKNKRIIPSEINNVERDLVKGSYGILEPRKDNLKEVSLDEINVVIVPGVVFDKKCCRIGYGGGYYDIFFEQKGKGLTTIGLGYDFQIVDKIPNEEFDIPLEYIITEKRIIVR